MPAAGYSRRRATGPPPAHPRCRRRRRGSRRSRSASGACPARTPAPAPGSPSRRRPRRARRCGRPGRRAIARAPASRAAASASRHRRASWRNACGVGGEPCAACQSPWIPGPGALRCVPAGVLQATAFLEATALPRADRPDVYRRKLRGMRRLPGASRPVLFLAVGANRLQRLEQQARKMRPRVLLGNQDAQPSGHRRRAKNHADGGGELVLHARAGTTEAPRPLATMATTPSRLSISMVERTTIWRRRISSCTRWPTRARRLKRT